MVRRRFALHIRASHFDYASSSSMSPYIAFYGDERLGGPASSPHSSSSSFHGSDVLKCHETRFALVFGLALLCCRQIPSSPFRLLIKIEIQYCWIASLLVGKLLDSIFIFFLLLFVLPPLIRTRQASIIFSWGRKYNCLCRRCWFSPRLLFPRYSIHGCKEMKAEKGN